MGLGKKGERTILRIRARKYITDNLILKLRAAMRL